MKKQLRIAHIGWVASCHLVRRVDELSRRGVKGVVFTDNIPDHFNPDAHDFAVEQLPAGLFETPLALVQWLEDRLTALDIDLLHAHSTHFPANLAYFVRNTAVINSPWDFVHSKDPFSPLFNQAIIEELPHSTLVNAVSFSSKPFMDEIVDKGLPQGKAFWHSWGVDLSVFSPGKHAKSAAQLRHRLGVQPDEIVLLSPRTPSLPANVDIAMQAVAELAKTHPVKLVVTGHHITREFGYYERLAARPDIAAATIFIDTVRNDVDIATLYEASDIVLSMHSNDYNPATILESFAMERPVLVHDLKTVSFWAEEDISGWTVPQRDVTATVAKLNNILLMDKMTWKRMGQAGRQRVLAQADFQKTMDQLPSDYEQVIIQAQKSPRPQMTAHDKGLLHDICGQPLTALRHYRKAMASGEQRPLVAELVTEKAAMIQPDKGLDYFCMRRSQPIVREMAQSSIVQWPELAKQLPIPQSLFRQDFIAGLKPLLLKRDFKGFLKLTEYLATHFSTDTLEWIGEAVILFGRRFGMWKECAEILLVKDYKSASLSWLALEISKELGRGHILTIRLLKKASTWSTIPMEYIDQNHDDLLRTASHGTLYPPEVGKADLIQHQ